MSSLSPRTPGWWQPGTLQRVAVEQRGQFGPQAAHRRDRRRAPPRGQVPSLGFRDGARRPVRGTGQQCVPAGAVGRP
ncbi:rCG31314, partial [Rattus norvegicus]